MGAGIIPRPPLGGYGLLRALLGYRNAGQDLFTARQQPPLAPPQQGLFSAPNGGGVAAEMRQGGQDQGVSGPQAPSSMMPDMNVAASAQKPLGAMPYMAPATGGAARPSFLRRLLDGVLQVPQDDSVTDQDRSSMRQSGLAALSASLLRGPQAGQPNNLFSMLGTAMPAGQEAAMGGLQRQDALQARSMSQQVRGLLSQMGPNGASPENMRRMMGILMMSGNVQGAKEMAEAMHSMQPERHFSEYQGTTKVYEDGQLSRTDGDGDAGVAPDNVVHALDPLYTRFHGDTDTLADKADAQSEVQATAKSLLDPNTPITQRGPLATSLVYAFVRSMVPQRITQTEINQAMQSGSGLPQNIMNAVNKLMSGTFDAEFIRGIQRAVRSAGQAQLGSYDRTRADYTRQAAALGIPAKNIALPDAWAKLRADPEWNQTVGAARPGTPAARRHPVGRSNVGR